MSNYQPNSYKSKEQKGNAKNKPKVEKVINGVANVKKKSDVRRIVDAFIPDDLKKVRECLTIDVLVPTLKKAVFDIVINGASAIFYPGSTGKGSGLPGSKVSHLNYTGFSGNNNSIVQSNARKNTYDYDDITFDYQADAEMVLMRMLEDIEVYQFVSINDLYDYAGVSGDSTAPNYGWMDLRSAYVSRVRDKWIIKLPRAVPFD